MLRRAVIGVSAVLALAVGAPAAATVLSAGDGTRSAATLGPRPLPPTFVPLELGAFPRSAAEACADNTRVVRVRPPHGIARALAAAKPGTTILMAPGTYRESRGEYLAARISAQNVCLRTASRRAVLRANPNQGYGLEISADDVVVQRLTLRGFSASVSMTSGGEGPTLDRIVLQGVRVEDPVGPQRDGIVAYDDNRSLPGSPPTVDGLLLLKVSVSGTDLGVSCNFGPCAHWWIERTRIRNRVTAEGSGADTFAIEEGRQIVVVDSTVRRAAADGIDTKADDVVVFGARVRDVERNAIKLWRGGDVIDSVVDGSGADASLVGDGPGRYRYLHVLVTDHSPAGNGYVGGWNYDDPSPGLRLEIVNSIFDRNSSGGFFAPASAQISVRHTIFGDRDSKLFDLSDGRSWQTTELGAFEEAGYGRANIVAGPRLADRDGSWTPRAGSPALDVAEPVAGLDRDLVGRPRTIGAGPDIGPVERPSR